MTTLRLVPTIADVGGTDLAFMSAVGANIDEEYWSTVHETSQKQSRIGAVECHDSTKTPAFDDM